MHALRDAQVFAVVARIPPAANPYAGRYTVEIKWNGTAELVIDAEIGATWSGQTSPFSLNKDRLSLTVYRPGAKSEWGRRSGEAYDGLQETIQVRARLSFEATHL